MPLHQSYGYRHLASLVRFDDRPGSHPNGCKTRRINQVCPARLCLVTMSSADDGSNDSEAERTAVQTITFGVCGAFAGADAPPHGAAAHHRRAKNASVMICRPDWTGEVRSASIGQCDTQRLL